MVSSIASLLVIYITHLTNLLLHLHVRQPFLSTTYPKRQKPGHFRALHVVAETRRAKEEMFRHSIPQGVFALLVLNCQQVGASF